MSGPRRKLHVALLAVPDSTASTLFGMYDVFSGTGRDWEFLVQGEAREAPLKVGIVARTAQGFRAANGVWIQPHGALADGPPPDIVCVTDLYVAPDEDVAPRYPEELAWLRDCHGAGATLATACSGAMLLAAAGLLDGFDATTHWGFCEALARRHPQVRVHPGRALVVSGTGQRLIMAGGGTSWLDLALYLIARFVGVEDAMRVAKINLIDWHNMGQLPFAALTRTRQTDDAVIARCQAWIADHYHSDAPVARMAELSGLAERSFQRRFAQATGMAPLEYVHTLRLEEAKQMLERSDLPVEAIAEEVGYQDASFFNRLFQRKVGLTPAQYRRRFGGLRQTLQQHLAVPTDAAPRSTDMELQ